MSASPTPSPDLASPGSGLWLQAFCDVLEDQSLTQDSDFFRSGGYSLLIPALVSRYEELAGWRPPVRLVFEFGTPRELEAQTAARRPGSE